MQYHFYCTLKNDIALGFASYNIIFPCAIKMILHSASFNITIIFTWNISVCISADLSQPTEGWWGLRDSDSPEKSASEIPTRGHFWLSEKDVSPWVGPTRIVRKPMFTVRKGPTPGQKWGVTLIRA
jgi:hypothetical protein